MGSLRSTSDVEFFAVFWVFGLGSLLQRYPFVAGLTGTAAYAPSKFAARALAEVLRAELVGTNITVRNVVCGLMAISTTSTHHQHMGASISACTRLLQRTRAYDRTGG